MASLQWIGKEAVVNHHREVPYRLLKGDAKLSVGPDGGVGSGNLLVQGDNLEALKALLPYYGGKVKCIYIDPPYNTGNEKWIYNDNVNSPEMREWLGKVVKGEAEDLSRHDKWLCMMYPRLSLLAQFLTEDGAIFVSIDDNEVHALRTLLDEIFTRQRFVACCVWQKRYSRENRGSIGDVHEYLVVYAKDPERFKHSRNRVPLDEKNAKVYKNPNKDPRGRWRPIPMTAQGHRPNQMYKIELPSGKLLGPPKGRCWSMVEPEFMKLKAAGRIYFGKKGNSAPGEIRYLDEVEGLVPWTWWPHEEVGHTDEAKKEVLAFAAGQEEAFDTPKPERLMKRVIEIASNPGDIVLDCFCGSGTTAAVAHKLGRSWVACDSQDFVRTLVTRRLQLVVEGKDLGGVQSRHTGGGFRFATLGPTLFDEFGHIRPDVRFADLAAHVFFTETGEPIPKAANGKKTPFIGVCKETAYYLLFNGILGDKRPDGGNVLTGDVLADLPTHDGPRVVFGEACRLGAARLAREGITFKQIPYEVKGRPSA